MKNKLFTTVIILLSFLVISCKNKEKISKVQNNSNSTTTAKKVTKKEDSLFAYIERTPCHGTCPTYKISIYKSGYAIYQGIRFVKNVGTYEAFISQKKLADLKSEALKIKYFDLKDKYVNPGITDLPSMIITLNFDGQKKTVVSEYSPPESIVSFGKYFDSLMQDDVKWKKKQ